MNKSIRKLLGAAVLLAATLVQASGDFKDHGVPVPVNSNHGCTVARGDHGQNVMVMLMKDYQGLCGFYQFDFTTGAQHYTAVPEEMRRQAEGVFSSLYSSRNRYYVHAGAALWEYNPENFELRHWKVGAGMGMAMTEDDAGRIWCVSYPDGRVICYNPAKNVCRDFGPARKEAWPQYNRAMAADDTGILYYGVGITRSQFCAFDPKVGHAIDLLPDEERVPQSYGMVFRADDGKVYGVVTPSFNQHKASELLEHARTKGIGPWYCFYRGKMTKLSSPPDFTLKPIATGSQLFSNPVCADGSRIDRVDPVERIVRCIEKGKTISAKMVYESNGAHISSVEALPDGKITGASSFPMRNFVFDPADGSFIHRNGCVQWNTMAVWENHLFVGGYNGGWFIDWDLSKPWAGLPRHLKDAKINPVCLGNVGAPLIRPHALICTADGRYLIMGGTPAYGTVGGALALYDRRGNKLEVIPNEAMVPLHSVYALVQLPDGRIFGGTTVEAGTGGKAEATRAEIFQFDLAMKKLVRHEPVTPTTTRIRQMCLLDNGRILCMADPNSLLLFDPDTWKMTALPALPEELGKIVWQQGPRALIKGDGRVFVLCQYGLGEFDPGTGKVSLVCRFPIKAATGGAYSGGRVYFAAGSHLYSVKP